MIRLRFKKSILTYSWMYRFTSSSDNSGLNGLTVTELKKVIVDGGLNFNDCYEKSDLVKKAIDARSRLVSSSVLDATNVSSKINHKDSLQQVLDIVH